MTSPDASPESSTDAPSDDLRAAFERAVAESKLLSERPDNRTLLQLYALYKQGSEGDAQGDRPGMTDFVARAKFDAWADLAGTAPANAQRGYIDLIESLKD